MHRRYRRNADMDISALERAWQAGDLTVFPALVNALIRADLLTVGFLVRYPQAFQYLPASWQFALWQMAGPGQQHAPQQQQVAQPEIVEDDDEEEEEAEERDESDAYECASCSDLYWEDTQNEQWALLTEQSAQITEARLGRGDEGYAMCEDCLAQAGLDLEQAVQEDLTNEFCLDCGYSLDECDC